MKIFFQWEPDLKYLHFHTASPFTTVKLESQMIITSHFVMSSPYSRAFSFTANIIHLGCHPTWTRKLSWRGSWLNKTIFWGGVLFPFSGRISPALASELFNLNYCSAKAAAASSGLKISLPSSLFGRARTGTKWADVTSVLVMMYHVHPQPEDGLSVVNTGGFLLRTA